MIAALTEAVVAICMRNAIWVHQYKSNRKAANTVILATRLYLIVTEKALEIARKARFITVKKRKMMENAIEIKDQSSAWKTVNCAKTSAKIVSLSS